MACPTPGVLSLYVIVSLVCVCVLGQMTTPNASKAPSKNTTLPVTEKAVADKANATKKAESKPGSGMIQKTNTAAPLMDKSVTDKTNTKKTVSKPDASLRKKTNTSNCFWQRNITVNAGTNATVSSRGVSFGRSRLFRKGFYGFRSSRTSAYVCQFGFDEVFRIQSRSVFFDWRSRPQRTNNNTASSGVAFPTSCVQKGAILAFFWTMAEKQNVNRFITKDQFESCSGLDPKTKNNVIMETVHTSTLPLGDYFFASGVPGQCMQGGVKVKVTVARYCPSNRLKGIVRFRSRLGFY